MLRSRRYLDTPHTPGSAINHTTYIDKPTVQQLKIAFQETPIKLREIEQRWKGRRKELMTMAVDTRREMRTHPKSPAPGPRRRVTTHAEVPKVVPNEARSYLPSPPATPPEVPMQDRDKKSRPTTQSTVVPTSKSPDPIIAHPLVPTSQPVRIMSGAYVSIPSRSHATGYELKLDMGDNQIVVLTGGRSLSLVSKIAARKGAKPKVSLINLDECDDWTEDERMQWTLVMDLVEGLKRKTPRVRIFHPQATITVTCSEVPDVIVQFTILDDHATKLDRTYPSVGRSVRLVYSPSRHLLKIHTSTSRSGKPSETSFRTRRIVSLEQDRNHNDAGFVTEYKSGQSAIKLACEALGIHDLRGWMESEIEALERFWASREEWSRYVSQ